MLKGAKIELFKGVDLIAFRKCAVYYVPESRESTFFALRRDPLDQRVRFFPDCAHFRSLQPITSPVRTPVLHKTDCMTCLRCRKAPSLASMSKIVRYEFMGNWLYFWLLWISVIETPLAILYLLNGMLRIENDVTDPEQFASEFRAGKR